MQPVPWRRAGCQRGLATITVRDSVRLQTHAEGITLSEAAYERLAAHKREDGTFSDVVVSLTDEPSLLELADIHNAEEVDAVREPLDERRERRGVELEERFASEE